MPKNAERCLEAARASFIEVDRERFEVMAHKWWFLASEYEASDLLLQQWTSTPRANDASGRLSA